MKNSRKISLIFFTTLFTISTITITQTADNNPSVSSSSDGGLTSSGAAQGNNTTEGSNDNQGDTGSGTTSTPSNPIEEASGTTPATSASDVAGDGSTTGNKEAVDDSKATSSEAAQGNNTTEGSNDNQGDTGSGTTSNPSNPIEGASSNTSTTGDSGATGVSGATEGSITGGDVTDGKKPRKSPFKKLKAFGSTLSLSGHTKPEESSEGVTGGKVPGTSTLKRIKKQLASSTLSLSSTTQKEPKAPIVLSDGTNKQVEVKQNEGYGVQKVIVKQPEAAFEKMSGKDNSIEISIEENAKVTVKGEYCSKIKLVNCNLTDSKLIVNNTAHSHSELEATLPITSSMSMPNLSDTDASIISTPSRRSSSIIQSTGQQPFDLSFFSSTTHGGKTESADRTVFTGVGSFVVQSPTIVSSDLKIYGNINVNKPFQLITVPPVVMKTLTVERSKFVHKQSGVLNLQSDLTANIEGKDAKIVTSGSNPRISFNKFGTQSDPILVKVDGVLKLQAELHPSDSNEVNMYASITPKDKSVSEVHFLNSASGVGPTMYHVHGFIGTPGSVMEKIVLDGETMLNVSGNIYAGKVKLNSSNKVSRGDRSTHGSIMLNGESYVGLAVPSISNYGTIIVHGNPSTQHNPDHYKSMFYGNIGTSERSLYSIKFAEHPNNPDGTRPYTKLLISHDKNVDKSSIYCSDIIFSHQEDTINILSDIAIKGNIGTKGNSGGRIIVHSNSTLTHSGGNIGRDKFGDSTSLQTLLLREKTSFVSTPDINSIPYTCNIKEITADQNSSIKLNSNSDWKTNIIPAGNGVKFTMSQGSYSGNIGSKENPVASVTLLPKSKRQSSIDVEGFVHTNQCSISDKSSARGEVTLLGDYTVTAQTSDGSGSINVGNVKFDLGCNTLALGGDNIKLLGHKSNKESSTNPDKFKKRPVTVFSINYTTNSDGTVKTQGKLKLSKHYDQKNKIILDVSHQGNSSDLTKHGPQTTIHPVDIADTGGESIHNLVYICDSKCKWQKVDGSDGKFVFAGLVDKKKKDKGDDGASSSSGSSSVAPSARVSPEVSDDEEGGKGEDIQASTVSHLHSKDSAHSKQSQDKDHTEDPEDSTEAAIEELARRLDEPAPRSQRAAEQPLQHDPAEQVQPVAAQPLAAGADMQQQQQQQQQQYVHTSSPSSEDQEQSSKPEPILQPILPKISDAHLKSGVHATVAAISSIVESKAANNKSGSDIVSSGSNINKQLWNIWADGFFSNVNQQDHEHIQGYKTDISGISIGADKHLKNNAIIGAAISYAKFDTKHTDSRIEKINSNVYLLSLYGQYSFQSTTFIRGMVNVAKFGDDSKNSSLTLWQGHSYHGSVTAGHYFYPLKNNKKLTLVPTVGIRHSYFNTSGNNSVDSSSNKTIGDRSHKALEGIIGISLEQLVVNNANNNLNVLSTVYGYVHHNLYDCQDGAQLPNSNSTFNPDVITAHEQCLHKTFYQLGVKLAIKRNIMDIGIACDVYLAEKYISHTGIIYAKASF
ncbi:ScaA autotransporter protein [Orientia tsutsugamushi]|uniref:ScaA autotransporter protein n=1 Tax=Orientia tsutsugamushi TaxID=784 RepID=A0A2R8F4H7_ORITS|nr:autotransporter domain-containing protein [Orientia tsutsugamushi]SPM46104.1 ScaA autotransporter protein [Orientia tsutsugamushi]